MCGEAVTEGYKYLENVSEQQRKDIVKRIPFIQYSFVIDSGFDRLKEAELETETQDSAVYPVISAEALKDENVNINSDKVIFAVNDISYLTDDKRRDVKVRILREELDNLNDTITKLNSRKQTVLEDYVLSVNAGDTSAEKLDAPEELLREKMISKRISLHTEQSLDDIMIRSHRIWQNLKMSESPRSLLN